LEQVSAFLEHREAVMAWYREAIPTSESIRLNYVADWARSSYWMVCLEVDWFDDTLRSAFMRALRDRGIDTRPYFYPLSSMPMYTTVPAPVAERKAAIGVNLPIYYGLSRENVHRVAENVNGLLRTLEHK
jgi:perosamine synthetase